MGEPPPSDEPEVTLTPKEEERHQMIEVETRMAHNTREKTVNLKRVRVTDSVTGSSQETGKYIQFPNCRVWSKLP